MERINKMKLKLVAGNMSDDASLCFTDNDWVNKEYSAMLSDEAIASIAKAREYLASTTPYLGTYCRFVSLHARGFSCGDLESLMGDYNNEEWREGITDLRVFPGKGVFYYMQHDDNCGAWIEFEVLTENGEPL